MSDSLSRRRLIGTGLVLGAAAVTPFALPASAQAQQPTAAPLIGPPTGDRLHIMTFNLRFEGDPPPRSWPERRPLVDRVLGRERPTVICTQEGLFGQLQDVHADRKGYDWIHLGRLGGSRSEATAVYWDAKRLKVLEYDHLWLSDTPRLIGSRDWGNTVVRMLTWVHFADLRTGKDWYVVNNHFDHQSDNARHKGSQMNLDVIADFDAPTIVAGDFNNAPDTPTRQILADGGLVDTWDEAAERRTPEWETFNYWEPEPRESANRIDWIMAQPSIQVHQAAINTYSRDGLVPSDHWPVQALVSLP